VANTLLGNFRRVQRERRETLESVRKRLLAGRDPQSIVEFDESLVGALRAQKDLTEGDEAK